jgi:hypothetical protein
MVGIAGKKPPGWAGGRGSPMEKASIRRDPGFFERFNDSSGSLMVADARSLLLRLIAGQQEVEQLQRDEDEVFGDLFRPVGSLGHLDFLEKLPVP